MNEYQQVRILCREVPANQQENGKLCPWCNGGRHGEKSMSIFTRHDGVSLYICHRATCGKAGRVLPNGNASGNATDKQVPVFYPRPFTGDSRKLTPEEVELIGALFGLTQREIIWHRLSMCKGQIGNDYNRLLIPIQGPKNQLRGHITSLLPNQRSDEPKVSTYRVLDETLLGWFWSEGSKADRVVVVEDAISAMRVARHYYAVALLGTHLSVDDLFEILKQSDNIVLALDKDATSKALDYQQRYRFIAPQMQVAVLDKDFKYCNDEEILTRVA